MTHPLEKILDEALARYASGEPVESIVASFPDQRREVEDVLLTARALELDRDRVEPPAEVLRAALTGGSVTKGVLASYREGRDDTKGRTLAHDTSTVLQTMWKTLVPVAVVIAVVLVVVVMRSDTTPTLTLAPGSDADEAAFDELVVAMNGYFDSEDELTLALDAASNGVGAAVSATPSAAGSDPLDSAGIEKDAAAVDNLEVEQFLNTEDGLEGDLNF